MLEIITNGIMTSSGMDIGETFRPEDLGKTDFFDFVTGSGAEMTVNGGSSTAGSGTGGATTGGSAPEDRSVGSAGGSGSSSNSNGGGGSSGSRSNRNGPEAINGGGSGSARNQQQTVGSGSVVVGPVSNDSGGSGGGGGSSSGNNQPLQGFDQFWGPDKDTNRLDQSMFDDINRYCWIQQQNSGSGQAGGAGTVGSAVTDTDGQIYTLTVLNGAPEPWVLRKDPSAPEPPPPASNIDLDTILGGFPGYVKTECFSYDDSGFGTDHHGKEDPQQQHLLSQQQQQHLHQQVQQIPVTSTNIVLSNSLMDPNSVIAYQNNNNDWQMSDHNVIEHETPESLLRSALQGKGYTKGAPVQLQNGITVIPAGQIKEEELRRVLYPGETDSLAYADSTLANPLFEDPDLHSPGSNNPQHQQHPAGVVGDLGSGVVVDDMFLTLDAAFNEDYEKLKRIATEVQQFCTDNNNYTEIIVETAAINQHQNPSLINSNNGNNSLVISNASHAISTTTSSDVVTTTSTPKPKAPRASKKYKRSLNSSSNTATANSSSIANNNNNSSMSNLNAPTPASILGATNHSTNSNTSSSNPSPTHCNGQRKERSLHYCSICSKGFKDKYSVNVHIRTHTGEKPFACSLCGKSFRQKAHLAKHYQTHMAQKNPTGSVKSSKQSRASAEQAASAVLAVQQQPPPPPPPSLTPHTAQPQQGGATAAAAAAAASILLSTATIVASR
ncbi:zinc finger protein sens [Toxorhynchites rutilus septentrionalis]|uniref:zinc finger protein sens n=1 Tax=Toxorhynchites rutilus septentrionalis TaxID=329112 RepID=UPI00247A7523|nr:zinc finger protein sens [Toxorhynchites rutilus septentrionalis]